MYKNGALLKDIAKEIGCSSETVARYLRNNNIKISNHKIQINNEKIIEYYSSCNSLRLTSEYFNISQGYIRTIILYSSEKVNLRSKNWNYENDSIIIQMYNNGLSAREIGDMFGFCHTAIFRHLQRLGIIRRKTSSKEYNGVSLNTFNRIKSTAKKRNLSFTITRSFINKLFIKQNKKCAISGINIILPKDFLELSTGVGTASLDRIDSSEGYDKANVQWVHKTVNIMKQGLSDSKFIEWCKLISIFNS